MVHAGAPSRAEQCHSLPLTPLLHSCLEACVQPGQLALAPLVLMLKLDLPAAHHGGQHNQLEVVALKNLDHDNKRNTP